MNKISRSPSKIKIHKAVLNGNFETVKALLQTPNIINSLDGNNNTPLHAAMVNPNPEMIQVLLLNNADPNIKNSHKMTPLHLAVCKKNGLAVVRLLIEAGAKINKADKYGNTPLHIAARYGYQDILEELLKAGANVAAMNNEFQMPLALAKRFSHKHCANLLEHYGAIPEGTFCEIVKFSFKTLSPLKKISLLVFAFLTLGITSAISILTSGAAAASILIAGFAVLGMALLFIGKQYYKIRALEKQVMNGKMDLKTFLATAFSDKEESR